MFREIGRTPEGYPVLVRPDQVCALEALETGTRVHLAGGGSVEIDSAVAAVASALTS